MGDYEDRWDNDDELEWLPWFRGEPSAEISSALQPKLYRPQLKLSKLLHHEQELRVEFRRCAAQLIQERQPSDKLELYLLMAHRSAPTRLLDWTDGALAALYFAIRHRGGAADPFGLSDAVVYMLDPWWLNDLAFQKAQANTPVTKRHSGVALPDWPAARRYLPEEMRSDRLRPERPLAVDPTHFSWRVAAQRSRFVVFGRDTQGLTSLANRNDSALVKIPVSFEHSQEILRDLKNSGISESMIFPDVDGLGRELGLAFQERCRVAAHRSLSAKKPEPVRIELKPSKIHEGGVGVFAVSGLSKDSFIAPGVYRQTTKRPLGGGSRRTIQRPFAARSSTHLIAR